MSAEGCNILALNLVVIRSPDAERTVAFYTCLGLSFAHHRHGSGPEHFAAELNGGVFEIYPLAAGVAPTTSVRIGFAVRSVDDAVAAIEEFPSSVISPPKDSEWGRRAVVTDPDGHRVELTEPRAPWRQSSQRL